MKGHKLALTFVVALVLASCATQPAPHAPDTPGFFLGLFNGFTVMFSLIGSIFFDVRVYAFPNNGGWYDFGFVLGVAGFFGTAPALRSKFRAATTDLVGLAPEAHKLAPEAHNSEVPRQTIRFIVALCLTVVGAFSALYLSQFAASSKDWMLIAAGFVFAVGVMWLVMCLRSMLEADGPPLTGGG